MADKTKPQKKISSPELEEMLQESDVKASAEIAKIELVEKQNIEIKRLMRILPFQIFLLVADADENIDPKEVAGFKDFLIHREKHCSNSYTRRMFHSTVVNFSALTARYHGGHLKKDFKLVQKSMDYIVKCVPQKIVADICKDLSDLAVKIAESSGGFLGVTSPISKEENEMIEQLNQLFELAIHNAKPDLQLNELSLDF